jgi:energy-converting hydrogenase Eha subunit A
LTNPASANPPVTAAGLSAVVMGLLAAFTDASADQVAAVGSAVGLVAAFIAQRFTVPA